MSNKHTPGPWLIHPHIDIEYSIFDQMGTTHVCDVTDEADAKLIAAAPELLEAAEALLVIAEFFHDNNKKNKIGMVIELAKAAIRKATE